MCIHGPYAGVTASDDEIILDCPKCVADEDRRIEWADDDRRDQLADVSGIYDDQDGWD